MLKVFDVKLTLVYGSNLMVVTILPVQLINFIVVGSNSADSHFFICSLA